MKSNSPARIVLGATGSCRLAGDIVTLTSVGTCRLTAKQAATSEYQAGSASASIQIAKGVTRFHVPSGETWADLPSRIGVEPSSAPPVAFDLSLDHEEVCTVSRDGLVDVYDRDGATFLSGDCYITAVAGGSANWASVDQLLVFEIGRPVVQARIVPGQSFPDSQPGQSITLEVEIVDNDGEAIVAGFDDGSGVCSAFSWGTGEGIFDVDIELRAAGTCRIEFDLDDQGVFAFTEELPSPFTISVTD